MKWEKIDNELLRILNDDEKELDEELKHAKEWKISY